MFFVDKSGKLVYEKVKREPCFCPSFEDKTFKLVLKTLAGQIRDSRHPKFPLEQCCLFMNNLKSSSETKKKFVMKMCLG